MVQQNQKNARLADVKDLEKPDASKGEQVKRYGFKKQTKYQHMK